jgi:hypothetical protein
MGREVGENDLGGRASWKPGGLRAVASAKRELEGGKRFFPPFFILD